MFLNVSWYSIFMNSWRCQMSKLLIGCSTV
nr:MAG TPA: Toll-like receptor 4-like receptor, PROTEIN RECEPTOR, transmembrane [Microviridae sp.]